MYRFTFNEVRISGFRVRIGRYALLTICRMDTAFLKTSSLLQGKNQMIIRIWFKCQKFGSPLFLLFQPVPLFKKLEQKFTDEQKAKYAGKQVKPDDKQKPKTEANKQGASQPKQAQASQAEIDSLAEKVTAQVCEKCD